MTGIADLFASLDGRDAYELQLEMWCHFQRSQRAEYFKDWRAANREHVKAYDADRRKAATKARARRAAWAKYVAQWRASRPVEQCRDCAAPAVPGKRSCAEHLAKNRARAARQYEQRAAANAA